MSAFFQFPSQGEIPAGRNIKDEELEAADHTSHSQEKSMKTGVGLCFPHLLTESRITDKQWQQPWRVNPHIPTKMSHLPRGHRCTPREAHLPNVKTDSVTSTVNTNYHTKFSRSCSKLNDCCSQHFLVQSFCICY